MGGKIGEDYEIPYMTMSEAYAVMTTVVSRYNAHISRKVLAQEMKMTPTGGGFYFKLNALKDYGLIEGRSKLTATNLAQTMVRTKDPNVLNKAKIDALSKFPFFSKLSSQLGNKVPDDETLIKVIGDLARVDRLEAERKLSDIKKVYADAVTFMGGMSHPEYVLAEEDGQTEIAETSKSEGQIKEKMQSTQNFSFAPPPGMVEIKIGDKAIIWVEPNHSAVRQAEGMLAVFKAELPPEEGKEKPTNKPAENSVQAFV